MSANKSGKGCLPLFMLWVILVIISDSTIFKPWENKIVTLAIVVFFIGSAYSLLVPIFNILSKPPKSSKSEELNISLIKEKANLKKVQEYLVRRGFSKGNPKIVKTKNRVNINFSKDTSKKLQIRTGPVNPIINLENINKDKILHSVEDDLKIFEKLMADKQDVDVLSYIPKSTAEFSIHNKNSKYEYFGIFQYFPKSRYSEDELSFDDINNRTKLYSFKDGKNPEYYADLFASALIKKMGLKSLNNKCLLIVPAANKSRTEIRFKEFCKILSQYTKMENGFDYILNTQNREASHTGGNRNFNPEDFLKITSDLNDKELIIIDDVRTSGRSSENIFKFLKKQNPKSITFCYLARTV